ncbi:MAG: SpoIIE family protein phosphatase [Spirochaetota bacterium]|nr:SpoIIE family protein phosphatase [Spirochaetota bacterium]
MELDKPDKYTLEYLERKLDNLSKLVDINRIVNSTLDIAKLLTIIMETIKDIMLTEASTLLLYDEETNDLVFKVALGEAGKELTEKYRVRLGQGIAGWVAENRKALYINDVYSDKRFDPNFDRITGFKSKSILCSPLLFKGKLIGVIQAINPLGRAVFNDDDTALFNAFADQAVLAVQNAILFQNALEEGRIKYELKAASSIQKSLLPVINQKINNIKIAARFVSAREVGGEFYDIFQFNNDSIGIAIGDIHTRGIPGALYASIISGVVKALSRIIGRSPVKLLKYVNEVIKDNCEFISNVSLFYGVISCKEKDIQFVNAGVAYPIIVRNGVARYLKFEIKSIWEETIWPKRIRVKLEKDDIFIIITDGIVNIKDRGAKHLGLKRIMDFLSNEKKSPEDIVDSLIRLADDFADGLEKREDISVIAFEVE